MPKKSSKSFYNYFFIIILEVLDGVNESKLMTKKENIIGRRKKHLRNWPPKLEVKNLRERILEI